MPHLYGVRTGWQNENLARFLLSRFCFISQPVSVADDIGSDFYCTLFEKEAKGHHVFVLPRNSFVIQIKSSHNKLDLSGKADYLHQLEIPFFIGFINQSKMILDIYSGRGLDLLFAMKGVPQKLVGIPVPRIKKYSYYQYLDRSEKRFSLNFPRLAVVRAKTAEAEIADIAKNVSRECSLIHKNISSRRRDEFILEFGHDDKRIFAGGGSDKTFRGNYFDRLAEVFYNLQWLYQFEPSKFSSAELEAYVKVWKINRKYAPAASIKRVDKIYKQLGAKLKWGSDWGRS
jgi:hypothetical protein